MKINGIKTHNLKNININLTLGKLIGVFGPSGGGKTSLVYDTVYKLCSNVFNSIQDGIELDSEYIVDSYNEISPAVAIRQSNYNSNPRSTIYSYLQFPTIISSSSPSIPYSYLKLNNPSNECPQCKGIGIEYKIDNNLAINYNSTLQDIPFIAWKKENYGNDLFENLVKEVCKIKNININKKFSELSIKEQEIFLYSNENKTINIKYKYNKRYKTKKIVFEGYFNWLNKYLTSNKISEHKYALKFATEYICSYCKGSRININKYSNIKIDNINFIDFLNLPINKLIKYIKSPGIQIHLDKLIQMGIGYLNLTRSIPSLSGGELQKIKISNFANSKISNIFAVIDEISSGLHISDYDNIINILLSLKRKKNTLLLIEHNKYFLSKCDQLIYVGPGSGKKGGNVSFNTQIENKPFKFCYKNEEFSNFIEINNININNIRNQSIKIPTNSISCIIGKSGAGKSSLAKFIKKSLNNVIYMSQQNLKGNIRSTIASFLEINKNIALTFGKKFNKTYKEFMLNNESDILCKICKGLGVIKYDRGFEDSIIITCPNCKGKLFNETAEKFKINGYSIVDIYNLTFEELKDINFIPKFQKLIDLTYHLSLEHLSLNRKISTLSGGELKRIKFLKILLNRKLDNKIIIFDEPTAGLDDNSTNKIWNLIHSYKNKTLAIILIEHKPEIFFKTDFIIEIGPEAGEKGGKIVFSDSINNFFDNNFKKYKKYLFT